MFLSKLSLGFADYELERFTASDGTELLRGFLDAHWGEPVLGYSAQPPLDSQEFLRLGGRGEAHLVLAARGNQRDRARIVRFGTRTTLMRFRSIIAAQSRIQDEVAILLMGRLAFRKDDVCRFQARDVEPGA